MTTKEIQELKIAKQMLLNKKERLGSFEYKHPTLQETQKELMDLLDIEIAKIDADIQDATHEKLTK